MAYHTGSRANLLGAMACDALDIVVYPGAAVPGPRTALLDEDWIEVVVGVEHPAALGHWMSGNELDACSVLIPADGAGDFRRLCTSLVRLPRQVSEMPLREIDARLSSSRCVALISRGQRGELRTAVATRPLAPNAIFPVWISWSPRLEYHARPELLAALARSGPELSSPCLKAIIRRVARADDDTADVGGGPALG